ncbi:hypothetical protein [Prochlorothrix hollandica]|uniref:Uncharacterized protein n=1 Tax=Prochlorothrix hollandica PCC 9006 = CALU 1027 TaxID=317619 RepID=A0A0M2PVL4_PROHO|nr:hypothetical protein [Prochlorothrix hollandica]KKI98401.1 hypothetical protein PROH_18210 [Prochlorothrix hollandica PCC 9006 = CALU 1027]
MSQSHLLQIDKKVLEESRDRLVWQISYGNATLTFALVLICMLAGPIGIIILMIPETADVWKKIVIVIACLLPPTLVIGMLQIVGHRETWIFDRVQQNITIKVYRLVGESLLVYPYEQVKRVYLQTNTDEDTDPEELYQVWIEAQPKCNLRGNGTKCNRMIYTSSNQNQAQAWSKKLQYYCNFHHT